MEEWAREYLGRKGAIKSKAARELITVGIAIDAMLFKDRVHGLLNKISFEKLCKRAMGIAEAWREVEVEADWSKAATAGKGWLSKVKYEQVKRIDPHFEDGSDLFHLRELEEEVRKEMERDASLLKAQNKLSSQQKSTS